MDLRLAEGKALLGLRLAICFALVRSPTDLSRLQMMAVLHCGPLFQRRFCFCSLLGCGEQIHGWQNGELTQRMLPWRLDYLLEVLLALS